MENMTRQDLEHDYKEIKRETFFFWGLSLVFQSMVLLGGILAVKFSKWNPFLDIIPITICIGFNIYEAWYLHDINKTYRNAVKRFQSN
jgi:hypothetical protein